MARKGYKKYRAVKVNVDGITFDSKREAERYLELKQMVKDGKIEGLRLQFPFELQPGFINSKGKKVRPIIYKADFVYTETNIKIEDDTEQNTNFESRLTAVEKSSEVTAEAVEELIEIVLGGEE